MVPYEGGKLKVTGGFVLPDGTLLDESSDLESSASAGYGQTEGRGSTIEGMQTGSGRAARFRIGNSTSGAEVLASTNGGNHAGVFEIDNTSNDSSAVQGVTNGTGHAVRGIQRSAGGHAGDFKTFSSRVEAGPLH